MLFYTVFSEIIADELFLYAYATLKFHHLFNNDVSKSNKHTSLLRKLSVYKLRKKTYACCPIYTNLKLTSI